MSKRTKGKMKAWRREACPRDNAGKKIKGANRRAKLAGISVDKLLGRVA